MHINNPCQFAYRSVGVALIVAVVVACDPVDEVTWKVRNETPRTVYIVIASGKLPAADSKAIGPIPPGGSMQEEFGYWHAWTSASFSFWITNDGVDRGKPTAQRRGYQLADVAAGNVVELTATTTGLVID